MGRSRDTPPHHGPRPEDGEDDEDDVEDDEDDKDDDDDGKGEQSCWAIPLLAIIW